MAKSLRQRMQDGEVLTAMRGSLSTSKAELAAMWATGRYDYIWIDSQHTPYRDQLLYRGQRHVLPPVRSRHNPLQRLAMGSSRLQMPPLPLLLLPPRQFQLFRNLGTKLGLHFSFLANPSPLEVVSPLWPL